MGVKPVSIDPIDYLSKVDAQLAGVIKAVGQYSIKVRNNAFQSLVESIIFQQLAGTAATVIYGRFIKYYNEAKSVTILGVRFTKNKKRTSNYLFNYSMAAKGI